jgi:hypothetical protein
MNKLIMPFRHSSCSLGVYKKEGQAFEIYLTTQGVIAINILLDC